MLVKRVQSSSQAVSVSGVLSFPFISAVSWLLGWSTTTGFDFVGTTVFRKCRVNDACDAATDIFSPPLLFRKSFDVCRGCLHFSFFLGNREKSAHITTLQHCLLPQWDFSFFFQFSAVILKPNCVGSPNSSSLFSFLPKTLAESVNLNNLREQHEYQEAAFSKYLNLMVFRGSLLPAPTP